MTVCFVLKMKNAVRKYAKIWSLMSVDEFQIQVI